MSALTLLLNYGPSSSQGRLYINSSDIFEYPIIDPQYLSNNAGKHSLGESCI